MSNHDSNSISPSERLLRDGFVARAENGWRTETPHPVQNTDKELWREPPDDYYSNSIHVTASGDIGINVHGRVFVKSLEEWHALAWNDYQNNLR